MFTDLSGLDENAPPDAGAEAGPGSDANGDTGFPDEDVTTIDTDAGGPDACIDADITTDPLHCGACFHDCLGGACTFGKCSPVTIVANLPPSGTVTVAKGKLYVGIPGTIRQYNLDGTSGLDVANVTSPGYMATDGTYLYFAEKADGTIRRWPLAGGGVDIVLASADPMGIAVGDGYVYFTHYHTDGGIERVQLDGGGRQPLFDYDHAEDVDFGNGELILGGDGVPNELAVVADAGFGAKRVLSSGGGPCSMVFIDGGIYYGEQGTLSIWQVAWNGTGTKSLFVPDAGKPVGVAASDNAVYWRANYGDAGAVLRIAR